MSALAISARAASRDNRLFRDILQRAGLKCSQPRLKILDALCETENQSLPELHERMVSADVPISMLCLSQALRRLHHRGLLQRDDHKRYALAPEALGSIGEPAND